MKSHNNESHAMEPYINHVTLITGHIARTGRADVADEVLSVLYPWLVQALVSSTPLALPVPALSHYSAMVLTDGGMVATIYAPLGPHTPGTPYVGNTTPLVTIGVAQRSRQGRDMWAKLVANFGAKPGIKQPAEPWCAVALHPALLSYPDTMEWIADFERCLAWAWITRKPQLTTV